jgi:enoyl-CoA hydratase/carnithine racemase
VDDREFSTISVERRDQVDWVSLDRPEQLNAIDTAMATDLRDYFGSLVENRETRVVVLRGSGKAFCAGLDINHASSDAIKASFGGGWGFQGHLAEAYIRMRRCPQPIIALVHGPVYPDRPVGLRHGGELFPAAPGWHLGGL